MCFYLQLVGKSWGRSQLKNLPSKAMWDLEVQMDHPKHKERFQGSELALPISLSRSYYDIPSRTQEMGSASCLGVLFILPAKSWGESVYFSPC